MLYNLKALKSLWYNIRAGRSVVIKQWFVHELCGGEQTYVHSVYVTPLRRCHACYVQYLNMGNYAMMC